MVYIKDVDYSKVRTIAKKKKGRKRRQTLFKPPRFKKYAKMISFRNTTEASQSIRKLRKEFREAKTDEKKLRIARTTQYASNRAFASAKRKKLTVEKRKTLKAIGKMYDDTADDFWKFYAEMKKR